MPACADNPERCFKGQHSHAHPLALHPRSLLQALSSQCPALALCASDQRRLDEHSSFATRRIFTLVTGGGETKPYLACTTDSGVTCRLRGETAHRALVPAGVAVSRRARALARRGLTHTGHTGSGTGMKLARYGD